MSILEILLAKGSTFNGNVNTFPLAWNVAQALLQWVYDTFEAKHVSLKSFVNPKNGTAHFGAIDQSMPQKNKQWLFLSRRADGKETASIKPGAMSDQLKEFFRDDFKMNVEEFAKANAPEEEAKPATVTIETPKKATAQKAEPVAPVIQKKAKPEPVAPTAPTAPKPEPVAPKKAGKRTFTK